MRATCATFLGGFLVAIPAPATAAEPAWANLQPTTVLDGLAGPIDFAIAPDGAVWWNEYYSGNVNRYDPSDRSRAVMFHADPVPDGVERGLVGLALDPDVERNGVFYVYYTIADPADATGGTNRLSRIQDGHETTLLELSANVRHNGGRILFVPDGSMFVATGENDLGAPAQDPGSLLGKVLHLFPDGRAAPGNIQGYVYSLGHRNMYGLAYDEASERLFATENGNAERDEVNLILAGHNYGWPTCEGLVYFDFAQGRDTDRPCDDARFTAPIGEFYPNRTAAPTGAAVVDGVLYWASWNEGAIHSLVEDGTAWTDTVMFRRGGRINDLEAGPDGRSLYYSNWTHILRLDIPVAPAGAPGGEGDGIPSLGFLMALGVLVGAAAVVRVRNGLRHVGRLAGATGWRR